MLDAELKPCLTGEQCDELLEALLTALDAPAESGDEAAVEILTSLAETEQSVR
jgi:hypothetical protein